MSASGRTDAPAGSWRTRRAARSVAAWSALLSAGMLFAAVSSAQGQEAESEAVIGDAEAGSRLYAAECASCHGAGGQGGNVPGGQGEAPPINGDHVELAYWDLVVRTGRMPPPEGEPFDNRHRDVRYTDEQRADLNAYARESLGVEGDLPPAGIGDAGQGLETYAANCAACHGPTGAGGVAGRGAWTPQVAGRDPQTIASAVRVGPFEMPRFGPEQISDEEVADITAFLTEVAEDPGTPLNLLELNPVYLSGFVALLAVALLASVAWISGAPTWFPDPRRDGGTSRDGEERQRRATEQHDEGRRRP